MAPVTPTADPTPDPEQWVAVGHYSSLAQAYDHGLVILAMNEACRVNPGEQPETYELQAESAVLAKIFPELEAYRLECQPPPPEVEGFLYSNGFGLSVTWLCLVSTIYLLQDSHPAWVTRGVSSSLGLFNAGEWWRPFTALFLHGDISHLVGNLVSGFIVATIVSRWISSWKAWSLILACGTLGNTMTSWLTYPANFTSLGASTAVFGAVGILSGLGVAETFREKLRTPWLKVATPILAGVVLLGLLGGSHGSGTDVLGHVFGFSTGVVAGLIAAITRGVHTKKGRKRIAPGP